ncbi:hypothetical protein Vi05172_g7383 [Venturia inaequalis]|nr:hypothetical protein Vi05172_g7383 [Venturia inaequalis]
MVQASTPLHAACDRVIGREPSAVAVHKVKDKSDKSGKTGKSGTSGKSGKTLMDHGTDSSRIILLPRLPFVFDRRLLSLQVGSCPKAFAFSARLAALLERAPHSKIC